MKGEGTFSMIKTRTVWEKTFIWRFSEDDQEAGLSGRILCVLGSLFGVKMLLDRRIPRRVTNEVQAGPWNKSVVLWYAKPFHSDVL